MYYYINIFLTYALTNSAIKSNHCFSQLYHIKSYHNQVKSNYRYIDRIMQRAWLFKALSTWITARFFLWWQGDYVSLPASVCFCHGRKKMTRPSLVEGSNNPIFSGLKQGNHDNGLTVFNHLIFITLMACFWLVEKFSWFLHQPKKLDYDDKYITAAFKILYNLKSKRKKNVTLAFLKCNKI